MGPILLLDFIIYVKFVISPHGILVFFLLLLNITRFAWAFHVHVLNICGDS
jgi:hypothetical protein